MAAYGRCFKAFLTFAVAFSKAFCRALDPALPATCFEVLLLSELYLLPILSTVASLCTDCIFCYFEVNLAGKFIASLPGCLGLTFLLSAAEFVFDSLFPNEPFLVIYGEDDF